MDPLMMKNLSRMTDEQKTQFIILQTVVLAFNTGCLIDAMVQIGKQRKALTQYQKAFKYLKKVNHGLSEIACNPKADPMENREAVIALINDVEAEMILDGVNIDAELEKLRDQ